MFLRENQFPHNIFSIKNKIEIFIDANLQFAFLL